MRILYSAVNRRLFATGSTCTSGISFLSPLAPRRTPLLSWAIVETSSPYCNCELHCCLTHLGRGGNDVSHFLNEIRILGKRKRLRMVRRQAKRLPDSSYRRIA